MRRRIVPNQKLEMSFRAQGYQEVVGVDEVGRGSWAGPVVAAAVVLPEGIRVRGARDSKMLLPASRVKLARRIKQLAKAIGLGWASSDEVDQFGLTWAVRQSGLRALNGLGCSFDMVVLDGKHNYLATDHPAAAYVKADATCLSVACASIVAKVARDSYMHQMHKLYPDYDFVSNKGYGTPRHRQAIKTMMSPIHRSSWKPLMLFGEMISWGLEDGMAELNVYSPR